LTFALVLVGVPALAEEIIHFTNGTTMVIEAHEIDGDRVRVHLGDQAYLEFPAEQIEKIETATGEVAMPRPTANRAVPRPTAEAGIIRGTVPSRMRRGQWQNDSSPPERDQVSVDGRGMTVFRPFGNNAPANKRKIGLTGRQELRLAGQNQSDTGHSGTTRVGARHVLPPKGSDAAVRPSPIGLAARGGSAPPPKKKDPEKD
jgi:hypothetical protein